VVTTAAIVAVIAQKYGQSQANPQHVEALIFGVIGAFVVILFVFQSLDLARAEGTDARTADAPAAEIENPATLDEATLWAAMAVGPIDDDAARARRQIWSSTRSSMHAAWLVTALIFLTVPPIYLLDSLVPLVIGAPLIIAVALWKAVPLVAGGELDRTYDRVSRAMAPLGLAVTERPELRIEAKYVAPLRYGPVLHGALMLEGKRHGRVVVARMPAGRGVRSPSYVGVGITSASTFEFRARDGRLRAPDGAPAAAVEALTAVHGSTRWNGVRGEVGEGRIAVERKGAGSRDWLLDLWLAERLADALEGDS
jgi:hypothetical protein